MFTPNEAGFAEVERAVSEFETAVAERLADVARETVAVRTGATRDSIRVVESDGHAVVTADGAALYLEHGTSRMRAEPFMQPASDAVAREVPTLAREQLGAES